MPVPIRPGYTWTDVPVGFEFSMALKSDSTLWSWGFNGNGQLGNGTTTEDSVPLKAGTDHDWVKIVAGPGYGFGIKSDSTLYGWGAKID